MFCIKFIRENITHMSYKDLCINMNISMVRLIREININNIIDKRIYRFCKGCGGKVYHKNVKNRIRQENNNKLCVKCHGKIKSEKYSGEGNPFYGKKHSKSTLTFYKKIHSGKRYSKKTEFKKGHIIVNKKTNYEYWSHKYGTEEANKRLQKWKDKLSLANSGNKNPMYGKPSPIGSGNGWSGWYKGWYFRSLLELSYMIHVIERFNINWERAEQKKYCIPYKINGINRNYYADFIINGKYVVECKPKKLTYSEINKAKFKSAVEYCKANNLIFKVTHCTKMSPKELVVLYKQGNIRFVEKYEKRILQLI